MKHDFDRVTLNEVSRHYGRRRAVSRVSFELRSGEIAGVLGPNGAGKSTLIGMIATLVTPSSGAIRYGELAAGNAGAAIRGRIGLLAHELHLYPELSAAQNPAFFARLYGVANADAIAAALERAGLTDRRDDPVSTFSRGMRQKLALERALIHAPRLLLLDEPFTGLDDRAVMTVTARLRRLADAGTIVLVTTHDLDVAEDLVTRVIVVRAGQLAADEPAAPGLRSRYRSLVGAA